MQPNLRNKNISLGIISVLLFLTNGCEKNNMDKNSTHSINLGLVDENTQSTEKTEEQKKEAERQALIAEVEEVEAQIKSRYSDLERERDRNQELKTSLLGKSAKGCFADMKIESLEVIIDGTRAARKFAGCQDDPWSAEGSPTTMKIKLGPSILITNDETVNTLFPGSITKANLSDYKVSDIQYVKIEKGGFAYDNESKPSGCHYNVYETDRYQMDSIKIVVNGETIYTKNVFDSHMFERNQTLWEDKSFQTNQSWLAAMKIDDCSQQQ